MPKKIIVKNYSGIIDLSFDIPTFYLLFPQKAAILFIMQHRPQVNM